MPRDASGNYTLPAGNPVISGTIITPSWANPTMDDIGNEITDSLSRTGKGGMLVAFENASGSENFPGITWGAEVSSGFYLAAAADMRASMTAEDSTRWLNGPYGFEVWSGVEWFKPALSADDSQIIAGTWTFTALTTFTDVIADTYNGVDGDGLVDKAAAEIISGAWTFTANMFLSSIQPKFIFTDTDAAVDEKNWLFRSQGGGLGLYTADDAAATTIINSAWIVNRTGTVVDNVTFGAEIILTDGTLGSNLADITALETITAAWRHNSALRMANNVAFAGRNAADDTWLDMVKMNTNNQVDLSNTTSDVRINSGVFVMSRVAGQEICRVVAAELGGMTIKDRNRGNDKLVGYRNPQHRQVNASFELTQNDEAKVLNIGTNNNVITCPVLAQYTQLSGMTLDINQNTTIATNGTTLYWLNGSGARVTGNRIIAAGSVFQLYYQTGANIYIWGNGIS